MMGFFTKMRAGLQKLARAGEAPREGQQPGAGSMPGLKDRGEQAVQSWGELGLEGLEEGGRRTPDVSPPASELFWCPPAPRLGPADAETQRSASRGPTQDREGQRMALGGRWGRIGQANRINTTGGDNYMPSQGGLKRCRMWFAFLSDT